MGGIEAGELASLLQAPSADPYWKLRLKSGFSDLFFLTTQDKTPAFADVMTEIARHQDYPAGRIGMYIQPLVMGASCHCEFDFYHDPADQREVEKIRKLISEAADKMEAMGAFFSRPYGPWADAAYRRSGDTADMQKKVKGIFDPKGILNPGQLCFR
jgi:FAD/FMN-containing dehydrogenase